jgi:hypothetical protein
VAGESQFEVRELFETIMQHLLDNMPISNRASRLNYLLLQLKEGVGLKELMGRFDKKDLAIMAEHRKVIEILGKNLKALLQKQQYAVFKNADVQKVVLGAYDAISLDVNLAQLRNALIKHPPFAEKEGGKAGVGLVGELMEQTRVDFESNSIKFATEEDQMMLSRIHGREVEKLLVVDPFSDFGLEKDSQFDHVSKYGIFCSKKEEEEQSKEGVFNYRLHRTMFSMEKLGFLVPQENIKLAKDLALFVIRLTDHHLTEVLKTAMKVAQVTSRSNSEAMDEVAYFQAKTNDPLPAQEGAYGGIGVSKLKYPSMMRMYRELRTIELIEEERLHDNLLPEMMERLTKGKKRLNKDERVVSEYFAKKPTATDTIAKLKADTEKDPTGRQKNAVNRIAVQPRHVKYFIENHSLYRNHQISWRFNAIY